MLMLLLVAAIDFGRAFKYGLQLNDAAFQGARTAGLNRAPLAAIRSAVRADLPPEVVLSDSDINVTPALLTAGSTVTVTVSWQYQPMLPLTRLGGSLPFVGAVVAFMPGGSPLVGSGSTIVR
jgi:hypothetical protein